MSNAAPVPAPYIVHPYYDQQQYYPPSSSLTNAGQIASSYPNFNQQYFPPSSPADISSANTASIYTVEPNIQQQLSGYLNVYGGRYNPANYHTRSGFVLPPPNNHLFYDKPQQWQSDWAGYGANFYENGADNNGGKLHRDSGIWTA